MEQLRHWCICQVCGRVIAASSAKDDGWLVGRWRPDGVRVIRCYAHWSDWAMRQSGLGRTASNRKKMAAGRERAANETERIKPVYEPFPMEDRP